MAGRTELTVVRWGKFHGVMILESAVFYYGGCGGGKHASVGKREQLVIQKLRPQG